MVERQRLLVAPLFPKKQRQMPHDVGTKEADLVTPTEPFAYEAGAGGKSARLVVDVCQSMQGPDIVRTERTCLLA
jgi:hypothetical protein